MTPMTFYLLCFITGCAKMIDNLQNSISQPFGRDFSPVIKLKG